MNNLTNTSRAAILAACRPCPQSLAGHRISVVDNDARVGHLLHQEKLPVDGPLEKRAPPQTFDEFATGLGSSDDP